ncbi:hypothetical protein BT67DRAFT_443393 [Trichocladium antarcticum]|uniref:Zn(2)-C6 fungal-type domain-containing protein n=1 Tax=Trichocladium antarcticum TaxID=1450529 RepID=A0AAN6ZCM5_9PEZI|nr:hypothetical protein BT67DRAFT_443393 [Trichocladium antarcticum]
MERIGLPATTPLADKPFHTKRAHRKTRAGCRNCKARKVKCDEGRPGCRACTARNQTCIYTIPPKGPKPSSAPEQPGRPASSAMTVLHEPLFIPARHDELDMRLLWFYTTTTYTSFSTGGLRQRSVDIVLKVNVVQHAFANPFLMDCVLGLAAMHVNHLKLRHLGVPALKELAYRARALETYRRAVEAADPATFPALLACSLLLCGLSTHVFRGREAQPLAILDWMVLWKGIGTIVEVTRLPLRFQSSGIATLFFRPDADLDASAQRLPGYLLSIAASISAGDPDFPLVATYYAALQHLGSLYLELARGLGQMLLLRIATYPTFLPAAFINAARERRPRALVILAHYLVFVKLRVKTRWWMDGISDHEIPSIAAFLGPAWEHLLRVPVAALQLTDHEDIARLLLDDPPIGSAPKT